MTSCDVRPQNGRFGYLVGLLLNALALAFALLVSASGAFNLVNESKQAGIVCLGLGFSLMAWCLIGFKGQYRAPGGIKASHTHS